MESEIKVWDGDSLDLGFAHSLYPMAAVWGGGSHDYFLCKKGKSIYRVPGCDVVSEKTNESVILTATFISY